MNCKRVCRNVARLQQQPNPDRRDIPPNRRRRILRNCDKPVKSLRRTPDVPIHKTACVYNLLTRRSATHSAILRDIAILSGQIDGNLHGKDIYFGKYCTQPEYQSLCFVPRWYCSLLVCLAPLAAGQTLSAQAQAVTQNVKEVYFPFNIYNRVIDPAVLDANATWLKQNPDGKFGSRDMPILAATSYTTWCCRISARSGSRANSKNVA